MDIREGKSVDNSLGGQKARKSPDVLVLNKGDGAVKFLPMPKLING
jgi:hypothetical protein